MKTLKVSNKNNPQLEEVYKDKSGNRWYGNKNPLDIGAIRGVQALTKERYVTLKISESELSLAFASHSDAAKTGDIVSCFAIIDDLKHRQKMLCEANSILDLAGIYYFLEGEDPEESSEYWELQKQKIWVNDSKCRSFFLLKGINLIPSLQNSPTQDLMNFMEETKWVCEKLYRHIKRPSER